MIIKNLTPDVQVIKCKEITDGRREYEIYLSPLGVTDLERVVIQNLSELAEKIEVEGVTHVLPVATTPKELTSGAEVDETDEIEVDGGDGVVPDSPEVLADKFICEICGAEFASSRSLNSHKTRSHSES